MISGWRSSNFIMLFALLYMLLLMNGDVGFVETRLLFKNGRSLNGFLGAPSRTPPPSVLRGDKPVDDLWFTQPLDHFNNLPNAATWQQRYFVNADHYQNHSNAPIFLMIGGEAEASKRWMKEGAWIRYAEQFGAFCFQVEHRYYGESHPTSDLSTTNLQFLTSEQALADLAAFIKAMRVQYNFAATQKWIVFGGSYPGSLAAWLREKYPELVHGAISSSGPLLAKVNFFEYFDVVKASLETHSDSCVLAVGRAFSELNILMRHMIGLRNIDEKFKTCTPIADSIENRWDIANFFENVAGYFADVVQYNKDNSPHSNNVTIDDLCDMMLNTTVGPPVTRLAMINGMMLQHANETCLEYKYDKLVADFKNTSWEAKMSSGMRQWVYQTCNEFGFYQTVENTSNVFGGHVGVDFFIKQCMDIYSMKMDETFLQDAITRTNRIYGALRPNTTNVLYVHGSIDPWHALGLTTSNNPKTPTIYIKGTAHCANMYEPIKSDPPQLVNARNAIIKFLAQLLDAFAHG